jgi:hypothetical protein
MPNVQILFVARGFHGNILLSCDRFKADLRFCIFSPFRLLSGILMACSPLSFERSPRMSATAFRCFPFYNGGLQVHSSLLNVVLHD